MVRKNKDGSPKDHGQQYDEIVEAQRRLGHERIQNTQGSKDRDKQELASLADKALERLREQKQEADQPDEEDR